MFSASFLSPSSYIPPVSDAAAKIFGRDGGLGPLGTFLFCLLEGQRLIPEKRMFSVAMVDFELFTS